VKGENPREAVASFTAAGARERTAAQTT